MAKYTLHQHPELTLIQPQETHVAELGRICYEAFKELNDKHQQPLDWPDITAARRVLRMLVQSAGFFGVAALMNGEPVGSNFISVMDSTAGIGPLTVDCSKQGCGIGRLLMKSVLEHAAMLNMKSIRLQQDASNLASLSLYESLGFDVCELSAFMTAIPSEAPDPDVRPISKADLNGIEALCVAHYKTSRIREIETLTANGLPGFVRCHEGAIRGYYITGKLGHGVAGTEEDAMSLVKHAAHVLHPQPLRFHCPLRLGTLYRDCLRSGFRGIKLMTLMALGEYQPPTGIWLPSVLF